MHDLDELNDRLHQGASTSLVIMSVLLAAFVTLLILGWSSWGTDGPRPVEIVGLVLVPPFAAFHLYRAVCTLRTRFSADGVVRQLWGRVVSIPWQEIRRVRIRRRRVLLDRQGGSPFVLTLLFAADLDDAFGAICQRVPLRALQGPSSVR